MSEKNATKQGPTCRCGHHPDHPAVYATPIYGVLGWFMLMMGASWMPKKVTYRCRSCRENVETTRDRAVRRKFL